MRRSTVIGPRWTNCSAPVRTGRVRPATSRRIVTGTSSGCSTRPMHGRPWPPGGPRPDRRCRRPSTRIGCSMPCAARSSTRHCPTTTTWSSRIRWSTTSSSGRAARCRPCSRITTGSTRRRSSSGCGRSTRTPATGGRGTTTTAGSKPTPSGSGCSVATRGNGSTTST